MSSSPKYHNGKLIVVQDETIVTNEQGVTVRRSEKILEDDTRVIEETPVTGTDLASPETAIPSAPPEMYDIPSTGPYVGTTEASSNLTPYVSSSTANVDPEIPMVHATAIPATSTAMNYDGHTNIVSEPVTVSTRPSQPGAPVIQPTPATISNTATTNSPRPPPQVIPQNKYVKRDEQTGACFICGLSLLVMSCLCCCCLVPAILFPLLWLFSWSDVFDDNNDDVFNDSIFSEDFYN